MTTHDQVALADTARNGGEKKEKVMETLAGELSPIFRFPVGPCLVV
jgi:hypothetical protein